MSEIYVQGGSCFMIIYSYDNAGPRSHGQENNQHTHYRDLETHGLSTHIYHMQVNGSIKPNSESQSCYDRSACIEECELGVAMHTRKEPQYPESSK
jgi:hypothetical protein